MDWQREFVDTFCKLINRENAALNRFNKNRVAGHRYEHGVKDLIEVQLQYLLFKELLRNSYFDKWVIRMWDPLSDRKKTKSKKRHVDFALTKTKYGKVDDSAWIYIEMKNGIRKAKKDYMRLQEKTNGLLVYQFGQRPINLEAKISKSPEFKRLMKKFKSTATGDKPLHVVSKDGKYELYHFEAVLLSWPREDA